MQKKITQLGVATALSLAVAMPSLAALKTEEEKIGYSLGVMVGNQLKGDLKDLHLPSFSAALEDVFQNKPLQLSEAEAQTILMNLERKLVEEAQAEAEALSKANAEEGKAFLDKNAKKRGIKVTASGLQYQITKNGKGAKPKSTDQVRVHYEGKLLNDKVFDSSYARGEPVTFKLNQVIAGWQEGLQLMNTGSTAMLYIPAELAYGTSGAGADIGPNSTLIFKVELLEILKD